MNRNRLEPTLRVLAPAVLLAVFALASLPAEAASKRTGSQLEFGIQMAKRGLWNEALFRFSRVLRERPGDAKVLNNIAVAYEAIGEFEKALEHYKLALEKAPSNRELRRNYAQFVEFYEGLRPQTEDPEEGATDSAPAEATADDGA